MVLQIYKYVNKRIIAKNELQEEYLLKITFNNCIALKRLGKLEETKEILKDIKIRNLQPLFKFAYFILMDDHDKYLHHLKDAILTRKVDLNDYNDWPLFEFIRNIEILNTKSIQLFEEYNIK